MGEIYAATRKNILILMIKTLIHDSDYKIAEVLI